MLNRLKKMFDLPTIKPCPYLLTTVNGYEVIEVICDCMGCYFTVLKDGKVYTKTESELNNKRNSTKFFYTDFKYKPSQSIFDVDLKRGIVVKGRIIQDLEEGKVITIYTCLFQRGIGFYRSEKLFDSLIAAQEARNKLIE